MVNPNQNARNAQGRYARTTKTVTRDAEACDLRAQGWKYRDIAAHFGINVHTAYDAVQNGLKTILKEPAEAVRQFELDRLDTELERLNNLETAARTVLERHHVIVSNGQVVRLDGEPLLDDAPVLQAIDRLLKIEESRRRNGESRRKLLGLDAPSRVSIEAEQLGRQITKLLDAALGPDDADDDPDA